MKNVYLYSYNAGSNGGQELADALDITRIKHDRSKFRGASFKTVINWGSGELPREIQKCRIINKPSEVHTSANKLSFFRLMKSISHDPPRTVPWTTSQSEAQEWLKKDVVVVRNSLTGHSGHGIIIVEPGQPLPRAPLYTKYIPKKYEFRVHIVAGRIIDVVRKIRDPNREPTDWKVRSHDNGFIFVRGGFTTPPDVQKQAIAAFMGSGLDFGAVDVVFNEKSGLAYVLEINTAPGLEGQTIQSYANAFRTCLGKSYDKRSVI